MFNSSSSSKPPNTNKNSQSHDETSSGKHPAKDKALPRCTATEILVAGFETILSDLFDWWPKIARDIRAFPCSSDRVSPRLPVRRGISEWVCRLLDWLPFPLLLRLSWMYRRDVRRLGYLAKLHPRGGTFPLVMLLWLHLIVWRRWGVSRAVP